MIGATIPCLEPEDLAGLREQGPPLPPVLGPSRLWLKSPAHTIIASRWFSWSARTSFAWLIKTRSNISAADSAGRAIWQLMGGGAPQQDRAVDDQGVPWDPNVRGGRETRIGKFDVDGLDVRPDDRHPRFEPVAAHSAARRRNHASGRNRQRCRRLGQPATFNQSRSRTDAISGSKRPSRPPRSRFHVPMRTPASVQIESAEPPAWLVAKNAHQLAPRGARREAVQRRWTETA